MRDMKERVQIFDSQRMAWVKYNSKSGAQMQIKKGPNPFKRIKIYKLGDEGRGEFKNEG